MIIQQALKGISGISPHQARAMLRTGIICNWWRNENPLPEDRIPERLNARNLQWHQNCYEDPDPQDANEPFCEHTPFISVTAGTIEREGMRRRNVLHSATQVALEFATGGWRCDGCVFCCYVFVLGRNSVSHRAFAEELRELNVFTGFSPFQPEGEITAKISIPPTQIRGFEFYEIDRINTNLAQGILPVRSHIESNVLYQEPTDISNVRSYLTWPI